MQLDGVKCAAHVLPLALAGELLTRANGEVQDRLGRPAEAGQVRRVVARMATLPACSAP